ncbi:hypothetical protein [Streptomyces montanisoli]|uniref:DUF4034 domain-containing protein n=1 Tax=Streptomyces montanisoli TaxID=2798581 RepID=A0A940MAT9_9ACTN|nr:hypothetical protein [Streptomyces montanisoli]MBP0456635.1 hypothetical protein [Streptomyces montanisoli]
MPPVDPPSPVPPPAGPQSDPYVTTPALVPLRSAAQAGDWAATRRFLTGLGDDDQAYAVRMLTEIDDTEAYLERAAAENPDDPLARTLVAARYVVVGWNIRTHSRPQYVSRDQFTRFHEWLRRAEELLIGICADHPSYALAWNARLATARGLELGQSEARRRYDRLAAHHPYYFASQRHLLQKLCPKWGGTYESLHEFARTCADAAPPGSLAGALVADAHMEHWLELDEPADGEYIASPEVRDELTEAAARSVLHPDHRPGFWDVTCHSLFAMALSTGGHHAEAAPHFKALGERFDRQPWGFLRGDPESQFVNHRTTALTLTS